MTLEQQIQQCRDLWTKARQDGNKVTMGTIQRKADFLKRVLARRDAWVSKYNELKLKKTEADELLEKAKKIFGVD